MIRQTVETRKKDSHCHHPRFRYCVADLSRRVLQQPQPGADATEAPRPRDFPIYGLFKNVSRKIFFISPSKTLKVFWTPAETFGDGRFRDFRRGFLGVRSPIFLGERAILDSSLFNLYWFSHQEIFSTVYPGYDKHTFSVNSPMSATGPGGHRRAKL